MNKNSTMPAAPSTSKDSIPLHCNICPKRPDFSDTSHLLTHIASKGHLSNYYKMKVKGSTDPASRELVEEYDDWYEEHNMQDLMRERMSQKEKKKVGGAGGNANGPAGSRRGSAATSATSGTPRNTPAPSVRSTNVRRGRPVLENTLDPQLGVKIKTEPLSRSTTPLNAFALEARQYVPPMKSWPTTPYGPSPGSQEASILDSLCSTPSSEFRDDLPQRASARRAQRNLSEYSRSLLGDEEVEYDDGSAENTKLKGVRWDGMGMFDSATLEMRRKRNQKKATSVIAQLQATSEVVEPEEFVFDAAGELRRTRVITGEPNSDDDGSPLKGESSPEPEAPPKRKAGRKPRQALTERNVNVRRASRNRRGESHHPPFNNGSRKMPYYDGLDEDDDLTYRPHRSKPPQGLRINVDNTGPEITIDRPMPMATLTSSFRDPFHPPPGYQYAHTSMQNGGAGRIHQRHPSLTYPGAFRAADNDPFGLPPPNFGSFGHLSGQTMFQNSTFQGSNPFTHSLFANCQQPLGMSQQPLVNDNSAFTTHGHNHSHSQTFSNPLDLFGGFGAQDPGFHIGAELGGFSAGGGDLTSVNPLFFSSNQVVPDDDEATVSPPASEQQ